MHVRGSITPLLAALVLATGSARAELSASDRRDALELLAINDPAFLSVQDLPEVELLAPEELRSRVQNMERGNLPYDRRKRPWLQLSVQSLLARDYNTVLHCLENADRKDEFRERPLPLAAYSYGELGRWEDALAAWQSIVARRNDKNSGRLNIAFTQIRLLRFRAARETLEQIERPKITDGDLADLQGALRHIYALHAFAVGDLDTAWKGFIHALDSQDRLPASYIGLCLLSQSEGTHEDAIGWLKMALRHSSSYEQLVYVKHPLIRRLEEHPMYREALEEAGLEKYILLPPGREILAEETPAVTRYHSLHAIPDAMRIKLKLRIMEPINRSL